MKMEKTGVTLFQEKGTIYRSYQDGFAKAVENFDKYIKDYKTKRSYHLKWMSN